MVLVGGGPGDPELMSIAGRRALMEADVVVADRLAPRELLGELPSTTELVDVAKIPRGRFTAQEAINDLIVSRALAGQRVVRFKGGDSFVFGRGFEEVIACRDAGVPVTVIPGLTSPIAVPALAGIPVTHRGVAHDFTVLSGHLPPEHAGLAGRLGGRRPADRHPPADDGRRERARHRVRAGGGRPGGGHPRRGRLRRLDARRTDRLRHPRHPGRGAGGRTPSGRRRSSWSARSSGWPIPRRTSGRPRRDRRPGGPAAGRLPRPARRLRCASTSRPSTGSSSPRGRRSSDARSRPASRRARS